MHAANSVELFADAVVWRAMTGGQLHIAPMRTIINSHVVGLSSCHSESRLNMLSIFCMYLSALTSGRVEFRPCVCG